jgi:hypothetical protein
MYSGLGAEPSGLSVVGDPSTSERERHVPPDSTRICLIGTVGPQALIGDLIEVILDSGVGPIELLAHPRSSQDDLARIWPKSWQKGETGTTYERLSAGGSAMVIQYSSGAGLEALTLGLPLVELCNPSEGPSYPYCAEPVVRVATNSDQLRSAYQESDRSEAARSLRTSYARSWVSTHGEAAVESAIEVITAALDTSGCGPLCLDSWRAS